MPKSKEIGKYKAGMLDLIESICNTGHPAVIAYTTPRQAAAARFDFYGLIGALKHHDHSLAIPASTLSFSIVGTPEAPEVKRILKIELVTTPIDGSFYERIAQEHEADAARNPKTLEELMGKAPK